MLKRINEWRSQREQSEKWVSKVLAFVLFFRTTYDCCNDCHADETHYSVECAPPLRLEEDPLFVPLQSRIALGRAFSASDASREWRGGSGRRAPRSQNNGQRKPRAKSKICLFPRLLNRVSNDSTKLGDRYLLICDCWFLLGER
jgi:hypothetical protein